MYPSINIATTINAVRLFARKLTAATKNIINLCLELIRFGMSSTLISFNGDYCRYHSRKKEEQGLSIGGYEYIFLTNLVVSYMFENAKTLLNRTNYHGIYRDDGLAVFRGKIAYKKSIIY